MYNTNETKKQRGAVAVEFAIVLPLLLLLFAGITEFGLAYYNKQILTNASREGARVGIVNNTSNEQIREAAFNYASERLITFGDNTFSTNNVTPEQNGDYLKVSVNFEYTYLILQGFNFFGANFGQTLNIGSSTVMKME